MKNRNNIIIIGAGASGLFLASYLNEKNYLILESSNKIANKLEISGGGRCNITNKNLSIDKYHGNRKFINSILKQYNNYDLLKFLKQNRVEVTLENKFVETQYFLKNSKNIIDILTKKINKKNIQLSQEVIDITHKNNEYYIKTKTHEFITKKVVVASGGKSFSNLGATDIAYNIAKKFGHKIIPPKPALTGYTVNKQQFWFKKLSGLSINIKLTIENNKKEFIGNALFSHKGITGPAIFFSTIHRDKGNIIIDFLHKYSQDIILKKIKQAQNKNLYNFFYTLLPKRFINEFFNSLNISNIKISQLDNNKINSIISTFKSYKFSPSGTFGFSKAEVTKGGIDTNQIDSKNLESKLQKNLFFLGEALDVTGEVGGYNLQWAFSCAMVCAKYINGEKR